MAAEAVRAVLAHITEAAIVHRDVSRTLCGSKGTHEGS